MDPDAARRVHREHRATTAAARLLPTTNPRIQPRRITTKPKTTAPITFPAITEPLSVTDSKIGRINPVAMVHTYLPTYLLTQRSKAQLTRHTQNKDAHHTAIHLHRARDADLVEQFCRDRLPSDDIYVPAAHQPVNPEDEDDVVPDQHAAFGIQKATQARREPAWRDFGLGELMGRGPGVGGAGASGAGAMAAGVAAGGKKTALPR